MTPDQFEDLLQEAREGYTVGGVRAQALAAEVDRLRAAVAQAAEPPVSLYAHHPDLARFLDGTA